MAITIQQRPYNFSGFRQRSLMYVATSSEVNELGFQFKVKIEAAGKTFFEGYVPPNPSSSLIFDLNNVISGIGQQTKFTATSSIHSSFAASGGLIGFNERYPVNPDPAECPTLFEEQVVVTIDEAWIVDGVLTDNPDIHSGAVSSLILFNRSGDQRNGYRPNPNTEFAMSSDQSFLTDRDYTTAKWDYAQTEGQYASRRVYIAAFSDDFGVFSIPYVSDANKTARDLPSYSATKVRITLVPNTGSPTTITESLTALEDGVIHLPLYPGNIQASTLASLAPIKPLANTNWKCYIISLLRTDNNPASAVYVVYNAGRYGPKDCRFDRVRLGWKNSKGGYDYSNFIKKSERSVEVERKQYESPVGNFADATNAFQWAKEDRAIGHTTPVAQQFITINSDWISAGEFRLLKYLVTSRDVHMVDTNGGHIPVLVVDNQYTSKDERNGKLYNQTFRLQVGYNQWT